MIEKNLIKDLIKRYDVFFGKGCGCKKFTWDFYFYLDDYFNIDVITLQDIKDIETKIESILEVIDKNLQDYNYFQELLEDLKCLEDFIRL